jgi:hypothetical protein
VIGGIAGAIGGAIFGALAAGGGPAIAGAIHEAWDKTKAGLSSAWKWIKGAASSVWGGIKSVASSVWKGIKSAPSSTWNAVKGAYYWIQDFVSGEQHQKSLSPLDSAAKAALQQVNPTSIAQDKEYAARGYKNPNGTYSVTGFNPGTQASSTPPSIASLPAGTANAARLHTHGGDDPQYDNEHFSPQDKHNAQRDGVPSYLGTPSGKIKKYDPATDRVTIIYDPARQP